MLFFKDALEWFEALAQLGFAQQYLMMHKFFPGSVTGSFLDDKVKVLIIRTWA